MPNRTWTDEELAAAVATSTTIAEVVRKLGLVSGNYRSMRAHIERLGVDASHIRAASRGGTRRPRTWSDDDLRVVAARSRSYAEVMRALGYEPSGGTHRWLRGHLDRLGISTAHFTGQAWARGRTLSSTKRPLVELLVDGSSCGSANLRRRLITAGLKQPRCEHCGLAEWRGEPMPLMLDHINGRHTDNRLENLRILCPNCHALTPTWCARNRRPA